MNTTNTKKNERKKAINMTGADMTREDERERSTKQLATEKPQLETG